jgi:hypothetical protein
MKHLTLSVLLFVFATTMSVAQEPAGGNSDADKPTFEIVASPRQQIMFPTRPSTVRLRITIKNADEDYWCPDIRVEWGDGDASGSGGDCDPFEDAPPDALKSTTFRYSHNYYAYGFMEIRVRLIKGDETISVRTTDISLLGH